MRHPPARSLTSLTALALVGCGTPPPPSEVYFTWLSNTTWLVEADGMRIFADAALTRWDFHLPDFDRPETFRTGPVSSDTTLVHEVLRAVGAEEGASYILVGHGHTDHTIDLAEFARFTGATIIGARTICLQARAQGIPPERCRAVEGGEVVELGPHLDVRVIRWAHSGNPADRLGLFIQAPKELRAVPPVDPETGGLGQAPWQAMPNGGGVRAYLFRYRTPDGELTWLISDSGNPFTFDSIPQIGPDYLSDVGVDLSGLELAAPEGTPRAWLGAAVRESGIDSVDVWLGYASPGHVRQVHELLPSRYFVPHHWDAYLAGFRPGVRRPFHRPLLSAYLDSVGVRLLPQSQYLERFRLDAGGLARIPDEAVQERLGLAIPPTEGR